MTHRYELESHAVPPPYPEAELARRKTCAEALACLKGQDVPYTGTYVGKPIDVDCGNFRKQLPTGTPVRIHVPLGAQIPASFAYGEVEVAWEGGRCRHATAFYNLQLSAGFSVINAALRALRLEKEAAV